MGSGNLNNNGNPSSLPRGHGQTAYGEEEKIGV